MDKAKTLDDLRFALVRLRGLQPSRELALAITKVEEAIMWLRTSCELDAAAAATRTP